MGKNKLEVGREYTLVGNQETRIMRYAGMNDGNLHNFLYFEEDKPVRVICKKFAVEGDLVTPEFHTYHPVDERVADSCMFDDDVFEPLCIRNTLREMIKERTFIVVE